MTLVLQSAFAASATALGSAVFTFLLIHMSRKLRLVAEARTDRWHRIATPNTGGIAIALSCAIACARLSPEGSYRSIMAVGLGLALFGVIDDRLQLRPMVKLAGQAVAAAIVISQGVTLHVTHSEMINLGITFVWIIGITNAFNLIDNMDGLCAGVAIIIASFRFIAAIESGDTGAALTLAILAGAYAGFLFFNLNPATIFMGDGGSLFAGFVLASVAISVPAPRTRLFVSGLLYPMLTFLYPIFDTALVSILRRLAGRPISVGGRDHSSHRLVLLGLSERKAVWVLWGLAAAGCSAGVLGAWMPIGVIGLAVLLVLCVMLFGTFLGNLPVYETPATAPIRSHRIRKLIPTLRAGVILVIDTLLAGVALLCAFLVRWENSFSGMPMEQLILSLPIVCAGHAVAGIALRTFHFGWRWFGVSDFLALAKCAVCECAVFLAILWAFGIGDYSRGAVLLYAIFSLCFATGMRLFMRLLPDMIGRHPTGERAAVLGASESAELAILICQKGGLNAHPVVVLESDLFAGRISVRGIPVRPAAGDPVRVLQEAEVGVLIVPSNLEALDAYYDLIEQCEAAGIRVVRLELAVTPVHSHKTPTFAGAGSPILLP